MAVLSDLVNACAYYAIDFVTVRIGWATWLNGAPNTNDVASFWVRTSNSGQMNLDPIIVHVEGTSYGQVSVVGQDGPWEDNVFKELAIGAHQRGWGRFWFHADSDTNRQVEEIIKVHISSFDLNWDHLLKGHTGGHNAARDGYSDEIFPL